MAKVILGGESGRAAAPEPLSAAALGRVLAPPLLAFGLLLTGVGIVDLGILWRPLRFGEGGWEFVTVMTTFNALALLTTGFLFLTVAASLKNRSGWLRLLAVLAVLGCGALIAISLLFALNVPVALRRVPQQAKSELISGIIRTTAFAGLYVLFYAWLSWFTWRRAGAARRGVAT